MSRVDGEGGCEVDVGRGRDGGVGVPFLDCGGDDGLPAYQKSFEEVEGVEG